jgi:glycosyltransferase involved in cell wall biosynthesis
MKTLSAIIPVYNEENNLVALIDHLNALNTNILSFCIFVNDGSTDNSRELLDTLSKSLKLPHLIIHKKNGGKTSAIEAGTKELTTSHAIIFDSDLEYSIQDVNKMWEYVINDDCDFILSYRRFFTHSSYSWRYSKGNSFLSNLFGLLYNFVITDVMCCLKLAPTNFYQALPFKYSGFGIDVEIPMQIWRQKYKAREVEVSYKPRTRLEGKSITMVDGIKIVYYIVSFRLFYRLFK